MIYIDIFWAIIACLLLVPALVLFIQVASAIVAYVLPSKLDVGSVEYQPSVAVIVPAHNEETGLAHTLNYLTPQLKLGDRLIVVADNCTDSTANIAREAGAITLERFNQTLRGKGYALDHALQYLKSDPPEVVVIIDADCEISETLIQTIATICVDRQRPIQAQYEMFFPQRGGIKQQLTEFAWLVKNTIRPLGYQRLGLPCQLMGTGMAFQWKDLTLCNLANGHLVEDMKLGLDLAKLKKPPLFTMQAVVKSYFPTSAEGIATQRTRWEHGHLGVILHDVPGFLKEAIKARDFRMLGQVADLLVPPLSLLVMLILLIFSAAWIPAFYGHLLSLYIASFTLVLVLISVLMAWLTFGRGVISFKSLMLVPFVVVSKLPLYAKFILGKQVEWVRSKRDERS
jgi:cellulose synthase/poly-beta-1,6-N-acetylglucosamine synthase-like glycosyltransferase